MGRNNHPSCIMKASSRGWRSEYTWKHF